jgi:hypothetical protein
MTRATPFNSPGFTLLYQPIEGLSGKSSVKLSLTGRETADETGGFETLVSSTGCKPPSVSLRAIKIPNRARPAVKKNIDFDLVIELKDKNIKIKCAALSN